MVQNDFLRDREIQGKRRKKKKNVKRKAIISEFEEKKVIGPRMNKRCWKGSRGIEGKVMSAKT